MVEREKKSIERPDENCLCIRKKSKDGCMACSSEAAAYWCDVCNQTVSVKRCPLCGLKARKLR